MLEQGVGATRQPRKEGTSAPSHLPYLPCHHPTEKCAGPTEWVCALVEENPLRLSLLTYKHESSLVGLLGTRWMWAAICSQKF